MKAQYRQALRSRALCEQERPDPLVRHRSPRALTVNSRLENFLKGPMMLYSMPGPEDTNQYMRFSWRLSWTAILFASSLIHGASAQVAPLIANTEARRSTSLNGAWQAIVDPYDVGAFDYRAQLLKNNNAFYKNYKPQSESELVEYDFDTSGQL